MKTAKIRVTGRVQGVWFRGSAAEQAARLGVTGWAKNCPDGSVEVIACGPADGVDALVEWLRRGPRLARVDGIEVEPVVLDEVPLTFTVL
ncbi:MAG: acylphosphatase [Xanthomonadaceae bacterium]|nr:acylphosphatase [Xanthomonadaceae bacterium]